jgi:malto-oligosyltrehalose trehalohydrolase
MPTVAERATPFHAMPFGAELGPDGAVRFRLWAPEQQRVRLVLEGQDETLAMQSRADGWHELATSGARAGTQYCFELANGMRVPDPASRYQPRDVHGPSEVIDPAVYQWRDGSWRGRPWHEAVLYEMHVGAFTPEGTFRAAIKRLDHLVDLGVTALELMPLADFPGRRNWGYDGVLLFAPDGSYGRPDDLKALVDAAHRRGLMVLLDVVYNHFGPDGNYLPVYAPQILTDRHKTPWGSAINYDGDDATVMREFVIHNALYWLEEFHFDGLRLDAVHAIMDDSPKHLLEELAQRVHLTFGKDRHVHLILENEENEAHWLERGPGGRVERYTAQWNDDVHHGLHTAATGEHAGYYVEYQGDIGKLARALAEGFTFQGEMMGYRGTARGQPSAHLPPTAFIAFMQNHDQVGNRAFGDRLTHGTPAERVRAIAAVLLLAPQIPMLFMGEEWAAAQPFPFFCDFEEELAEAVRKGRRAEFAKFPEFQDEATRESIPDPTAEETFRSAKLDWSDRGRAPHAQWLDWYRRILAIRRSEIVPRLAQAAGHAGTYETSGSGAFRVSWSLGDGSGLTVLANLSDATWKGFGPSPGRVVWSEGDLDQERKALGPWSVMWSIADAANAQDVVRP